jgi:hypothetical protein
MGRRVGLGWAGVTGLGEGRRVSLTGDGEEWHVGARGAGGSWSGGGSRDELAGQEIGGSAWEGEVQ